MDRGLDKKNIIYLNFEDDRLFPIKLSEMDLILRAYHELYPDRLKEQKVLFLDEIQQIPRWEKYIRRIYDTESAQIYLTGSSSRNVSRDISTTLRAGPYTTRYFLYPLASASISRVLKSSATPRKPRPGCFTPLTNIPMGRFPEVVMEKRQASQVENTSGIC